MSESEFAFEEVPVVEVFVKDAQSDSSVEVPPEEWESLVSLPITVRSMQISQGLIDPGSGEVCCKYVTMSSSTVDRHPYFCYPGIKDPGIAAALRQPEPQLVYPEDGQELYLSLCEEMNLCPIRCFYRQLLEPSIDLSYYGINPRGVRAIAMALKYNRYVKKINFTDNFLSLDSSFHLGDMLGANVTLTELDLSGCRIGPIGAKQLFVNLNVNTTLRKLNLSRNEIEDEGVQHFANVIFKGTQITNVNFSNNGVTGPALQTLVEVFDTHNKLTHIDLSSNKITSPNAVYALCYKLTENPVFREMRLAWNGLKGVRVATAIKCLMKCKSLRYIDLSNNRLCETPVIEALGANLAKATSLQTLNLSCNPLTRNDALLMLGFMQQDNVNLVNLLMDEVAVDHRFVQRRLDILNLPFRKNAVITHGYVMMEFKPSLIDMKNLMLTRLEAICRLVRRKDKPDIALILLRFRKDFGASMGVKEFGKTLRQQGVPIDEELVDQMGRAFPGPKAEKVVLISLDALVEYVRRKWPDAKLPVEPATR